MKIVLIIIYVSELFKHNPHESYFGIIIACEEIPGSRQLCHTISRLVYMYCSNVESFYTLYFIGLH